MSIRASVLDPIFSFFVTYHGHGHKTECRQSYTYLDEMALILMLFIGINHKKKIEKNLTLLKIFDGEYLV